MGLLFHSLASPLQLEDFRNSLQSVDQRTGYQNELHASNKTENRPFSWLQARSMELDLRTSSILVASSFLASNVESDQRKQQENSQWLATFSGFKLQQFIKRCVHIFALPSPLA